MSTILTYIIPLYKLAKSDPELASEEFLAGVGSNWREPSWWNEGPVERRAHYLDVRHPRKATMPDAAQMAKHGV